MAEVRKLAVPLPTVDRALLKKTIGTTMFVQEGGVDVPYRILDAKRGY